jgi:hypothetical protein
VPKAAREGLLTVRQVCEGYGFPEDRYYNRIRETAPKPLSFFRMAGSIRLKADGAEAQSRLDIEQARELPRPGAGSL